MPPTPIARPLKTQARALRGHALKPRKRLAAAVCGDGREALVEYLRRSVRAQCEDARAYVVRPPLAARREFAYVRAVELKRRPVSSRLAVRGCARRNL